MTLPTHRLVAVAAAACIALAYASTTLACGANGYTYAGVASTANGFGIGATITPLSAFDVSAGHVAAWVGVGGQGQGPRGSDEWLQAGVSGFPGSPDSELYYEIRVPGSDAVYHTIAGGWLFGRPARIAVLELRGRPNYWRVWVNGAAASPAVLLPSSHGRWRPVATAESWDGGTGGPCNGFLYRFTRVAIAQRPGGRWQPLTGGARLAAAATHMRRSRDGSFLAAEGDQAVSLMASLSP